MLAREIEGWRIAKVIQRRAPARENAKREPCDFYWNLDHLILEHPRSGRRRALWFTTVETEFANYGLHASLGDVYEPVHEED